jgi:hypothetical protein
MLSFHGVRHAARSAVLSFLAGLVLVSCGGGGGGGGLADPGSGGGPVVPPASVGKTLTGTAATGAAIALGTVTLKDSAGSTASTATDASGKFSLDATGLRFPAMLLVQPNVPGAVPLFSAALAAGTVNITPLTTLQVFEASGRTDPSSLFVGGNFAALNTASLEYGRSIVTSNLEALLATNGVPAGADPVTTPFNANGEAMDAVVHNVNVVTTGSTPVLTNLAGACIPYGFNSKGTTFAVDGMASAGASALVGVREDWTDAMNFPSPAGYVADSLRSACLPGAIQRIEWSRSPDLASTRLAVQELKTQLLNAAKDGKQPINIVAHDWGTVIAYIALDELRTDPSVKVANLVTMGSPLWMLEPDGPGRKPLTLPVAQAVQASVPEVYRGQALRSLQNVGKWNNFNSDADLLAGPLAAAVNVQVSCPTGSAWVKGSDGADKPCNPHASYFQPVMGLRSGTVATALPVSLRDIYSLLANVPAETAPVKILNATPIGATPGLPVFPPDALTASIVDPGCANGSPSSSPKELRWTASEGAINYRVFRNNAGLGGNLAASQLSFQGLALPAPGQRDTYAVLAINANGATLSSVAELTSAGVICSVEVPVTPAPSCAAPQVPENGVCVTPATPAGLSIATTFLASGTPGTPYSGTLAAAGGKAPYNWSASGLPPGIAVSSAGAISGTPTAAGSFNVTVTLSDGSGPPKSTSAMLLLVVAATVDSTAAPTLLSPANNAAGQSLTPALAWGGGSARFLRISVRNMATNALYTAAGLPSGTTSFNVPSLVLRPATQYRWEVTACPDALCNDPATYRTSEPFIFTTAALAAPTLGAPANNAADTSLTPTLTWSGGFATYWRINVTSAPTNQAGGGVGGMLPGTQTSLSMVPPAPPPGMLSPPPTLASYLQPSSQYIWDVTACADLECNNAGFPGRTSAQFVFNTAAGLAATTASTPYNNQVLFTTTPTMFWSGGVAPYWKLSIRNTATNDVFTYPGLAGAQRIFNVPAGVLQIGASYRWDVTACPDTACSNPATYKTSATSAFSVAVPTAAPVAPALGYPSDGATGVLVTARLTWSGGAANYWRVSVRNLATNALHTSLPQSPDTLSYAPGAFLQAGVQYRWDVTACPDLACDNPATYRTSASPTFTAGATPPAVVAPTPVAPANNSVNNPVTPTLQWSGGSGAAWSVMVRNLGTGEANFFSQLPSSQTSYTVPAGRLQPNAQYQWQVSACENAICAGQNLASTSFYFSTGSSTLEMAAATATSPASFTTGLSLQPTLRWSGGTAQFWRVNIRNLSTNVLFTSPAQNPLNREYLVPSGVLQEGVQYSWEVLACPDTDCNNASTFRASASFLFTTAAAGAGPTATTLISPANNATNQSPGLTLQWSGGSAAQWKLTMRNMTTGELRIFPMIGPTTSSYMFVFTPLQANTQYQWDITACPDTACNDPTTYRSSPTFAFTTGS